MTKRTATKRHKGHKSILGLCLFVAITLLGQAPTFEGTWYGTINPPSLQFNIAVRFSKKRRQLVRHAAAGERHDCYAHRNCGAQQVHLVFRR